jgi:hypothetical protein
MLRIVTYRCLGLVEDWTVLMLKLLQRDGGRSLASLGN